MEPKKKKNRYLIPYAKGHPPYLHGIPALDTQYQFASHTTAILPFHS